MTPRPRTLVLVDRIVAVLREEGDGTPDEIAARVGTISCGCLTTTHCGLEPDGALCWCVRGGGAPGWRRAARHDVYRLLVQLRDDGLVARIDNGHGPDAWSLIRHRADDGLEVVWELPAVKR